MIAMPRRNPRELVDLAIEPVDPRDYARLLAALRETNDLVVICAETGHAVLVAGPDELTLDRAIHDVRAATGIAMHVGAPAVAYLETALRRASLDYILKTQGEFARLLLSVEPTQGDRCFACEAPEGALLPEHVSAVESAVAEVFSAGIVAGFPVTGVLVTLRDGAWHETASSPDAFRRAALRGLRDALKQSGAVLLEPCMNLRVVAPSQAADAVMADLRSRRGKEVGVERQPDEAVVTAVVPLPNLFGYASTLRSLTKGRGVAEMSFARDEIVGHDPDDPFAPAAAMRA
jgi:elongation factor G